MLSVPTVSLIFILATVSTLAIYHWHVSDRFKRSEKIIAQLYEKSTAILPRILVYGCSSQLLHWIQSNYIPYEHARASDTEEVEDAPVALICPFAYRLEEFRDLVFRASKTKTLVCYMDEMDAHMFPSQTVRNMMATAKSYKCPVASNLRELHKELVAARDFARYKGGH